mmetsp:Transcript_9534/g.17290  ORF Transcript_9534/g.17290 Transcript_9534/m.17290 type:complete len:163 (-) Transcript_9534:46-534(-)
MIVTQLFLLLCFTLLTPSESFRAPSPNRVPSNPLPNTFKNTFPNARSNPNPILRLSSKKLPKESPPPLPPLPSLKKVGGRVPRPLQNESPSSFEIQQLLPPLLLFLIITWNLLPHDSGVKFYSETYSATYSNGNLIKENRNVKTNVIGEGEDLLMRKNKPFF